MIRVAAVSLAAILCAHAAAAQTVKNGALSGTIVSAFGAAPSGGTDVLLLTTPATGRFVLTQACTQSAPGSNNQPQIRIVGSTIGPVALATIAGDFEGSCTSFVPGLAIPPNEELRCAQGGASLSPGTCSITGVLSKK